MNIKIDSTKVMKEVLVIVGNLEIDIDTSYVAYLKTFHISPHQTYVTAYDLIEIWGMSLYQYTRTLKNTTQKFLHSSVLPLDRIYRTYRILQ